MTKTTTLLAAALIASLPLIGVAQTANTPGGQSSTGTPLDQTKTDPGKIAPTTTTTSPTTTNPAGSTAKHTDGKAHDSMSKDGMSKGTTKGSGSTTPTGNVKDDVPTSK